MAECGDCTLCCKLLGVAEIQKPANQWCAECAPGKGCKIYNNRPEVCRDFECGWLVNDGDPELRPDRIHLVIGGESKKINAYIVYVDPDYPDAPERKKAQKLLRAIAKHGRYPNVLLVTGDKRRLLTDDAAELRRIERILQQHDPQKVLL